MVEMCSPHEPLLHNEVYTTTAYHRDKSILLIGNFDWDRYMIFLCNKEGTICVGSIVGEMSALTLYHVLSTGMEYELDYVMLIKGKRVKEKAYNDMIQCLEHCVEIPVSYHLQEG